MGRTEIFQLELPLKKKIFGLESRNVGILKYTDNEGRIGYGESSPLPGFSKNNFALAWAKRCALEMIQGTGQSIVIRVNGLITEPDNALAEAKNLFGYSYVKIKVGHGLIWKNILNEIISQTELTLRLDANSKLTVDEATELVRDLPKDRVEYFEDPVPEPEIKRFSEVSGLRCVTDGIDVIKPTFTGSVPKNQVILSSAYESSLGICHIAHAAYRLHLETLAHGLDTLNVFAEPLFPVARKDDLLLVPSMKDLKKMMDLITGKMKPALEF